MIIVSPILNSYFRHRLKDANYRKRVYEKALKQELRTHKLGIILLRNLNDVMTENTFYHEEFAALLNGESYQKKFWESDLGYMWYHGNLGVLNPSFQLTINAIKENNYTSHLDMGCGWGELSFKVAMLTKAEKIVGIDISEDLIQKAKQLHSGTRATYLHKDIMQVDEKFDLITIFGPVDYISPADFPGILEKLLSISTKEILLLNSLRKKDFEHVLNIKEAIEIKRYDVGYIQPINYLLNELKSKYSFRYELKKHGLDSLLARITIN